MKRSSTVTNTDKKSDEKASGNSKRQWGFGSILNGLAEYVRPKGNRDDNCQLISANFECEEGDGRGVPNGERPKTDDRLCSVYRSTQNISVDVPCSFNDRTPRLTLGQSSTLCRRNTFNQGDLAVSSQRGLTGGPPRTPVLPRFRRDHSQSSLSSSMLNTGTPNSSTLSPYPTGQSHYATVGIMPTVKLAQLGAERLPVLSEHNSRMVGGSAVRVKIAPPDISRVPSPPLVLNEEVRPVHTPATSTQSVVSALREKRKRICAEDETSCTETDQQSKKRRPAVDELLASQTGADVKNTTDCTSRVGQNSFSTDINSVTDQRCPTPVMATPGSVIRCGVRNAIEASYASVRRSVSRQGSLAGASRDGAISRQSHSISRRSSVCCSLYGSQAQLSEAEKVSCVLSDSPAASLPSSGRSSPIPSSETSTTEVNVQKHGLHRRPALLIKDSASKRRLAPTPTGFSQVVRHYDSLTAKDFEEDRQTELERAKNFLSEVTGTASQGADIVTTSIQLVSTSASAHCKLPKLTSSTVSGILPSSSSTLEVSLGTSSLSVAPSLATTCPSSNQKTMSINIGAGDSTSQTQNTFKPVFGTPGAHGDQVALPDRFLIAASDGVDNHGTESSSSVIKSAAPVSSVISAVCDVAKVDSFGGTYSITRPAGVVSSVSDVNKGISFGDSSVIQTSTVEVSATGTQAAPSTTQSSVAHSLPSSGSVLSVGSGPPATFGSGFTGVSMSTGLSFNGSATSSGNCTSQFGGFGSTTVTAASTGFGSSVSATTAVVASSQSTPTFNFGGSSTQASSFVAPGGSIQPTSNLFGGSNSQSSFGVLGNTGSQPSGVFGAIPTSVNPTVSSSSSSIQPSQNMFGNASSGSVGNMAAAVSTTSGTQLSVGSSGTAFGSAFGSSTLQPAPVANPQVLFGNTTSNMFGSSSGPVSSTSALLGGAFGDAALQSATGVSSSVQFGNTFGNSSNQIVSASVGSSTTSFPSVFGSSTADASTGSVNQAASNMFGSSTNNQSSSSVFGSNMAQPSSLPFGKQAANAFGNFSAQPSAAPFGNPAQQPSVAPFGNSSQVPTSIGLAQSTSKAFGFAVAQPTSNVFGNSATQPALSTFGNTADGSANSFAFGTNTAFGGSAKPATNTFGSQPTTQTDLPNGLSKFGSTQGPFSFTGVTEKTGTPGNAFSFGGSSANQPNSLLQNNAFQTPSVVPTFGANSNTSAPFKFGAGDQTPSGSFAFGKNIASTPAFGAGTNGPLGCSPFASPAAAFSPVPVVASPGASFSIGSGPKSGVASKPRGARARNLRR